MYSPIEEESGENAGHVKTYLLSVSISFFINEHLTLFNSGEFTISMRRDFYQVIPND